MSFIDKLKSSAAAMIVLSPEKRKDTADHTRKGSIALIVTGIALAILGLACLAAGFSGIAGVIVLGGLGATLLIMGFDGIKIARNIENVKLAKYEIATLELQRKAEEAIGIENAETITNYVKEKLKGRALKHLVKGTCIASALVS
jgi:hypothetical protein